MTTHAWLPYLATYGSFLVIVQFKSLAPDSALGWLLLSQVLIPGGLLLYFFARRSFPELDVGAWNIRGVIGDVLVGLVIAVVWIAPSILGWTSHPPAEDGFDPASFFGDAGREFSLVVRLIGFVLITPFIEELFVRSALLRYVAASRARVDFRDIAIGRFEWAGFLITVFYFMFSHVRWEWPVALVTGVILNLWLYYRGSIVATIRSHAVANLSVYVVAVFPDWVFRGQHLDLRFFL